MTNCQRVTLARDITGIPVAQDFSVNAAEIPSVTDGEMLETVLENLANYGRTILCKLASQYHLDQRPPGPNPAAYIVKRANLKGLVVYDFLSEMDRYAKQASDWINQHKLVHVKDGVSSLSETPALFEKLMHGDDVGKTFVDIALDQK